MPPVSPTRRLPHPPRGLLLHAAAMELVDLTGAPKSRLPGEVLAELPASTPGPPWRTRVHAVVWWQRAGPPPSPRYLPRCGPRCAFRW